jgi:ATP-dependent helicase/nuclease subunit A
VDAVAAALAGGDHPLDPDGVPKHSAFREDDAGEVRLLPLTRRADGEEDAADERAEDRQEDGPEEGERPGRIEIDHARRLAGMIAAWLDPAAPLRLPHNGMPVAPQDILVLVRKRTPFSAALVAALHQAGVPVAGVDRLKLSDPLAVSDLLAAVRFVVQPEDDLTLASLLVSPLLGLSHDALHALAFGRRGSLWAAVRASEAPVVVMARSWLEAVLGFADLATPHRFLERLLSVPLGAAGWIGRQRLLARLGEDARDAIETLLDQALAFEQGEVATLQGFLAWIEAGEIEVKRDPDAPLDAVRLMTVHGAKGLQAPVVILADASHRPNLKRQVPLMLEADGAELPFEPGQDGGLGERVDAVREAARAEMMREHWRLLYVALTRAETLLCVTGTAHKAPADPKKAPEDLSWYKMVADAMAALGGKHRADPHLGGAAVLVHASGTPKESATLRLVPATARSEIPDWTRTPAPAEERPIRLTSPSALAADALAEPPASAGMAEAARRGAVLHLLFERLPSVPAEARARLGEALIRSRMPGTDPAPLLSEALAVLAAPGMEALFGEAALAEAPVAARLGDTLIAGQVDRLWIGDGRVCFVDFKTSRRVPARAEAAPPAHIAQMAGYAAALAQVFPGAAIEAMLLYTAGPRLLVLPPALLAAHAPEAVLPYLPDTLQDAGAAPTLRPS